MFIYNKLHIYLDILHIELEHEPVSFGGFFIFMPDLPAVKSSFLKCFDAYGDGQLTFHFALN